MEWLAAWWPNISHWFAAGSLSYPANLVQVYLHAFSPMRSGDDVAIIFKNIKNENLKIILSCDETNNYLF